MLMKRFVGAAALFGLAVGSAHAATATLEGPTSADAGSQITVNLVVDLEADQSLGGGFDISWDAGLLSFVSSAVTAPGSDPFFTRPGDASAGNLAGVAFGSFNGYSGVVAVATLVFDIASDAAGSATINIGPNAVPAGPLVDFSGIPLDVVYNGLEVQIASTVIPLPAAAWLMLGGLGMLLGFRRNA